MRLVLYDMMRVDELATERLTTDSSYALLPKNEALYHQVFAVHKTSLEQFKTSLTFYQSHPGQFKDVLDGLQKYLDESQMKSDSVGRIKAESLYRKRPDSVNPLRLSPFSSYSLLITHYSLLIPASLTVFLSILFSYDEPWKIRWTYTLAT